MAKKMNITLYDVLVYEHGYNTAIQAAADIVIKEAKKQANKNQKLTWPVLPMLMQRLLQPRLRFLLGARQTYRVVQKLCFECANS